MRSIWPVVVGSMAGIVFAAAMTFVVIPALTDTGTQPSESSEEDLWCPANPITYTVTGEPGTRIDLDDNMWYNATYAGDRVTLNLMVGTQPVLTHSESDDFLVSDSDEETQLAVDAGYHPVIRFLVVPTVNEEPLLTYIEGAGLHVYVSITPVQADGYPRIQVFSEGETLSMTCDTRR